MEAYDAHRTEQNQELQRTADATQSSPFPGRIAQQFSLNLAQCVEPTFDNVDTIQTNGSKKRFLRFNSF